MLLAFPVITEGVTFVLAQDPSTLLVEQQTNNVFIKQGV